MTRTIDRDDLERLAIGAGILGTGGGGNPYLGKLQARQLLDQGKTIEVIPVSDVPDDALVTTVGSIGAPVVSNERPKQGDEYLVSLRALETHLGRKITHVTCSEIGGSNSMAPMIVAAQANLPVVDGDGMGRAFPELQMDTFMIYGINPTPAVISDPRGHVAIFDKLDDPTTLERYARTVTIQMGGSAGAAGPTMSGRELKRTLIRDTITLAIDIGDAVLKARSNHSDAVDAVLGVTGGQRLFRGKIVDVDRRLVGGFARGVLRIDGMGPNEGDTLEYRLPEREPDRPQWQRRGAGDRARSDLHHRRRNRRADHHRAAALRASNRSDRHPRAGSAQVRGGHALCWTCRLWLQGCRVRAATRLFRQ